VGAEQWNKVFSSRRDLHRTDALGLVLALFDPLAQVKAEVKAFVLGLMIREN
jgi:hypothetical protein